MKAATQHYRAAGNIVSTNATSFWSEIKPKVDQLGSGEVLEIDLRVAKMIDSVGLNTLVKAIREAELRSGGVRILVGTDSLSRLCKFTRLDQRAEIVGP